MITKVEGRWSNSDEWAELDKGFSPEVYDEKTLVSAMKEDKAALESGHFPPEVTYYYRVTRKDESVTEYNVRAT